MQKLNTLPFLYLLLLYDICNGLNLNIFQDEHAVTGGAISFEGSYYEGNVYGKKSSGEIDKYFGKFKPRYNGETPKPINQLFRDAMPPIIRKSVKEKLLRKYLNSKEVHTSEEIKKLEHKFRDRDPYDYMNSNGELDVDKFHKVEMQRFKRTTLPIWKTFLLSKTERKPFRPNPPLMPDFQDIEDDLMTDVEELPQIYT